MEEPRRRRWERAANGPLMLLAPPLLRAHALPILDPRLSESWARLCAATRRDVAALTAEVAALQEELGRRRQR